LKDDDIDNKPKEEAKKADDSKTTEEANKSEDSEKKPEGSDKKSEEKPKQPEEPVSVSNLAEQLKTQKGTESKPAEDDSTKLEEQAK
jgi:hypothetical protein